MRAFTKPVLLALVLFFSKNILAYKYVPAGSPDGGGINVQTHDEAESGESRAAACSPAIGKLDLEWNNVRARIETGGNMWQNRADGNAAYEVPKDGGVSSIYAGALWLGGKSADQTLKLAAVTFRASGNDYWPGPLTNDGAAEVTPSTCLDYDHFTVTLRQDAQLHNLYFEMIEAGASQEDIDDAFPNGYSIPSYFFDYPANGNTALGQDFYLAPFMDFNDNLVYDPENGDYPWYDFKRDIDCAKRISTDPVPLYGDQTYYWIFNDKGNIHSESTGQAIGMEIRAQAFAFNSNDEVNNMTFLNRG